MLSVVMHKRGIIYNLAGAFDVDTMRKHGYLIVLPYSGDSSSPFFLLFDFRERVTWVSFIYK